MASLLDRIQQLNTTSPQPQQQGIEQILRQKGGKIAPKSGPSSSNLGEQAAIGAGRSALGEQTFAERLSNVQARGKEQALAEQQQLAQQQLSQQEQLSQQQLAAEVAGRRSEIQAEQDLAANKRIASSDKQIKQINATAEQRLRDLASQRNMQLDDIFAQYEFDTEELENRRDVADLEQKAFLMAMQDKKYLDELNIIGKQRQLQNDINFDKEMQRLIMGDNLNGLLEELDFKADRNATQRQYTQELARMDFETAIALSRAAIRDEAERSKYEAAGNIVSAIGNYYVKLDEKNTNAADKNQSTGTFNG